jgi:zinc transport system permease protein
VAWIGWRWSALLSATLNEDRACAYGIDPNREQRGLSLAVAAGLIGMLSVIVGLRAALVFDTPAGPSIVCVAALTFVMSSFVKGVRTAA